MTMFPKAGKNTNQQCFVLYCESGYIEGERASFLPVPKDPGMFSLWKEVIPKKGRQLTVQDVICSKHFKKKDLIYTENIPIGGKRPELKKGAVPCFFKVSYTNHLLDHNYCADLVSPRSDETPGNEKMAIEQNIVVKEVPETYFHKLFRKQISLTLKNDWGIYCTNDNEEQLLLISLLAYRHNKPVMDRHITLRDNLSINYFVGNKKMVNLDNFPNLVETLKEFENVVNRFYLLKVCSGGPPLKKINILTTTCSVLDHSTGLWRHKKCNYISDTDTNSCSLCWPLHKRPSN